MENYLKIALAKYKNAGYTKSAVVDVLKIFGDLRPNMEIVEFADGKRKSLLQLHGTMPIVYKGITYNTPIIVWILDTYPSEAPDVYVSPTPSMYIRKSENVDLTGKVHTRYLKEWRQSSSDLLGLLQDIAVVFGKNPPMASIVSGTQAENVAELRLENYRNAFFTKQEVISVVCVYTDLRPTLKDCRFQDGMKKTLLLLEGTIPTLYRGNTYNTPICMYLMETHPFQGPFVYVTPMVNMRLNVSRHVDHSGRVCTAYLSEWNYPNCDLLNLIQHLSAIFGNIPPVYNISKTKQPAGNHSNIVLPVTYNPTQSQNHTQALSTAQAFMGSLVSHGAHGTVSSASGQTVTKMPADSGGNEGIRGRYTTKHSSNDEVSGKNIPEATAPQDNGEVPGRRQTVVPTNENCLGSAEDFDIHCDSCNVDNNFVEAEGFCKQCKEYYCKACLRYHGKIAATKTHTILAKDRMPKP